MQSITEMLNKTIKQDLNNTWLKSSQLQNLLNEGDIVKIEIKEYYNGLKYACKRDNKLMFKKKYNGCVYKWALKDNKHFRIIDKNYSITI